MPDKAGNREPAAPASWMTRGNNALWLVGLLWLESVVIMVIYNWSRFANLDFTDPDDAMRLVQVRDFLAGQSWFDVSQHRVDPPLGGPMHWSRLLDVPIAGIIALLRPLLGQAQAEIAACVIVPMITLGVMCLAIYVGLKRFLGIPRALLVVALLVTSFPILAQVTPLRIDHHGWQITMAAFVLGGVLAARPALGGLIAGAAMAMWLHISSEGLPYAAFTGAVLGARYLWRADEWPRLISYAGALAVATVVFLFGIRGWTTAMEFHCDGISVAFFPEFLLLFGVMLVSKRFVGDRTLVQRAAVPAAGALAAAILFATASRPCLAGPFYYLDPVVYRYWYLGILEGLPFWAQDRTMAAIILVPGIVGLCGLAAAVVTEKDRERRAQWLTIFGLALPAFVMSCMMLRAMSVAHLYALVGNGWLIARLYPSIAARSQMIVRALLTSALCLLSPAALATGAALVVSGATGEPISKPEKIACSDRTQVNALNRLPATTLFAPIDLGPEILLRTPHQVVATSHHRIADGLAKVIHAFLGTPDEAKRIVMATPSQYLLLCPSLNETQRYRRIEPKGFGAQMLDGKLPSWLTPVTVPGVTELKIYRINRNEAQAPTKRNATPFMQ